MEIPDYVKARIQGSRYAMIVVAAMLLVAMNTVAADTPGAASSGLRIYVLDTGNHRVQIFNAKGVYKSQFSHSFDSPTGIAVNLGNVYVKDGNANCEVDEFDSKGKYILQFGKCSSGTIGPGIFDNTGALAATTGNVWITSPDFYYMQEFDSSSKFLKIVCMANLGLKNCPPVTSFDVQPFGIALDAKGNIYVTNVYPSQGGYNVVKFSSRGKYLATIGSAGSGNGQFNDPEGIAVDSGGNNVVKFSSRGKYLATIGSAGNGNGQFNDPEGIAIDSAGNIYVVDSGNNRVEKFNKAGVYQSQFGSPGSGNGQFNFPVGIAFGADGEIYVTDVGNNRVEEFDSKGSYLGQFGSYGQGNGEFINPFGIAITE